jgi:hypothetical protein
LFRIRIKKKKLTYVLKFRGRDFVGGDNVSPKKNNVDYGLGRDKLSPKSVTLVPVNMQMNPVCFFICFFKLSDVLCKEWMGVEGNDLRGRRRKEFP